MRAEPVDGLGEAGLDLVGGAVGVGAGVVGVEVVVEVEDEVVGAARGVGDGGEAVGGLEEGADGCVLVSWFPR